MNCKPASGNNRRREEGFTLIEILIVLGILGGIMAFVLTQVAGSGEQAKRKESELRASQIQQAFVRYEVDVGRKPETKDGLAALWNNPGVPRWAGPYIDEKDAVDGWKHPFEYELSPKGPKLVSPGSDGEPGTADDLVFVNGKEADQAAGGGNP